MSERQTLLAILYGLCVIEALFWLRRGAAGFVRGISGKWKLADPLDALGNDMGAVAVGPIVPGIGKLRVCRAWPFAVSPRRLAAFEVESPGPSPRGRATGMVFDWDNIQSIDTNQREILVNGKTFLKADTATDAVAYAVIFRELKKSKPEERLRIIRSRLRDRLNTNALATRVSELEKASVGISAAARIFAAGILVVVPLVFGHFGWFPALWYVLGAWLAGSIVVTTLFLRTHRRFYPHEGEDRFRLGMLGLLVPAVTMRLPELLEKPVATGFHPIAGAWAWLSQEDARRWVATCWRDMNFPRRPDAPSDDEEARQAVDEYRKELRAAVEETLRVRGIDPVDWLTAPTASEPDHRLFCPRCETQFTSGAKQCDACGGIKLRDVRSSTAKAANALA